MKNTYFLVVLSFAAMTVHGSDYCDLNGNACGTGLDPYAVTTVASDSPIAQAFDKHVVDPICTHVVAPINTHVVEPVVRNIPKPVSDFAASTKQTMSNFGSSVKKRASELVLDAKVRLGLVEPVVEQKISAWQKCKNQASKAWNADLFGYTGAGKYAIVATASAVVLLSGYAVYALNQQSVEDQVIALVQKAQKNPNVILQALPAILDVCDNDDMRIEVLQYVLSHVEITPEIATAFNLQQ